VPQGLGDGGTGPGQHRQGEAHGLQQRHAEALVLAQGHEHAGVAVEGGQSLRGHAPCDPGPGQVEVLEEELEALLVAGQPGGTHQDEVGLGHEIGGEHVVGHEEEVGALVGQELADEEHDGPVQALEVVDGGWVGLYGLQAGHVHHQGAHPHVGEAHAPELGRVELRHGQGHHRPLGQHGQLPPPFLQQAREGGVIGKEGLCGRDVVVHDDQALGAVPEETEELGLSDGRVQYQQIALGTV